MYNCKRVYNYVNTGIKKVLLAIQAVICARAQSLFRVQMRLKVIVLNQKTERKH